MRNRSQTLQQIASELRASLTPSEAALWRCIQGCRTGVWFRRQIVVGRYIVDFVAPSARLVVEVDGGYHARRATADARRDRVLMRLGYECSGLTPSSCSRNRKKPTHASAQRSLPCELYS